MFRKLGILGLVAAIILLFQFLAPSSHSVAVAAGCGTTNIALNQPATSSANENSSFTAPMAVDGNLNTRWSSAFSDPQWLQVDLGSTQSICHVTLNWEAAYGKAYQIQVSNDATNWTTIYSTTTGTGGTNDLTGLVGSGRYIRMYGTVRGTQYGYSLWEFQVFAGTTATNTPTNTAVPPTNTATNTPVSTGCGTTNVALNQPATSSSNENTGTTPNLAVDGSMTTRWSSAFSDPQWLQVDLGSTKSICHVTLNWETAYGKAYQIQTSNDATTWTTIYSTTTGTGGTNDLTGLSGSGRYIRMYGTVRGTQYGYSLWEFQVFSGTSSATNTPVPPTKTNTPVPATATTGPTATKPPATNTPTFVPPTKTNTPVSATNTPIPTVNNSNVDFGPNVFIYDPSMSASTIQSSLDSIFNTQQSNQFGTQRYAELFKPGTYSVTANIGFYTGIAGLGLTPGAVVINGNVTSDAQWFNGNATQNFWRSAENMQINPSGGTDIWAVSQAAPFRRMNVQGTLKLDPSGDGYSSGGFIADSVVSGQAFSGSQQQYFTRNSQIGSWSNCVWNCVFAGVNGAPAESFPNPPYTTVGSVPSIAEKPFLYVDSSGNFNVFVPALRNNSSGTSWSGTPAGTSLPINQFYIVKSNDTSTTINNSLASGLNLIVTPGVYHLSAPINVTRANTVILGLGMATFINDNGVDAIDVADVDGVRIAGLLFDAGTTNAQQLLQIGPAGSSASHAANPTILYDIFARIGGVVAGKVTNAVVVNSNNVIIDDTWLWRADHGTGVGWTSNTANTGLIVNGQNVITYGLFVEHFQQYNVIWNANGGQDYFFQNELPYDPPNQAAYMNGTTNGWAAFKVANNVTSFQGYGLGSYCYFNVNPAVVDDHSFESPNVSGVSWHGLSTVSLGNVGAIIHVINSTGAQTPTNTTPSTVTTYP